MGSIYNPESALAIFAHPDDIEFLCAGTLARWAKAGSRIAYLLCTSGDVGIADPQISKAEAIDIRESETRAAAKIAGVNQVIFLREPDGMLEATMELRKKIIREIRKFKPEVIICGDPTRVLGGESYINHPDHRAAATVAIDAAFPAAGQPNLFEELQAEGITAHKPRKVYVTTWDNADVFINIEETIEIKIEALRAHKSQIDWDPDPRIREWAAETAKGKEMEYAEGYRVITLVSDEDWENSVGDPLKLDAYKKEKKRKESEAEKAN
ncbi:MAG: PIG-L family deacetylase [Chloroflexi bacterium]|nr:PIG-L family deacetylase [Chloroflexota bacterium]